MKKRSKKANKRRHLQRCRDQKRVKEARRINNMLRNRWQQLKRSKLVRAVIALFKAMVGWFNSPPQPVAEAA